MSSSPARPAFPPLVVATPSAAKAAPAGAGAGSVRKVVESAPEPPERALLQEIYAGPLMPAYAPWPAKRAEYR